MIIYLRAFNALHAQNISIEVLVQNVLTEAVLHVLPRDTFINKVVTMEVTLRYNSVECLWDFGDLSAPLRTSNTTVGYKYRHPGHYRVQVQFLQPQQCVSASVWKNPLNPCLS